MAADWLVPDLSLTKQLEQEVDRRKAAGLCRDDAAILVDKLIVDWYLHTALIDQLLGQVRRLEVDIALANPKRSREEPSKEHYQWATELLSTLKHE